MGFVVSASESQRGAWVVIMKFFKFVKNVYIQFPKKRSLLFFCFLFVWFIWEKPKPNKYWVLKINRKIFNEACNRTGYLFEDKALRRFVHSAFILQMKKGATLLKKAVQSVICKQRKEFKEFNLHLIFLRGVMFSPH